MNVYFQILTQVQTTEVIQLLLFACGLGRSPLGCQVKTSAGGRIRRHTFESVQEAVNTMAGKKFNQLEISYNIGQAPKFGSGTMKTIRGLFTPSATSELWFRCADFPAGGDREARNRKMNAKAAEKALEFYNVSRRPSLFEPVIPANSLGGKSKVFDDCAEWLAEHIPAPLEALGIFGCVDADEDYFIKLESDLVTMEDIKVLINVPPPAYPELGKRFDALHPLLFGAKPLCKGLASCLGKGTRVIESRSVPNFAVVRISDDCNRDEAQRLASKWLVANTPPPGFK